MGETVMDPIERSAALRREADVVLREVRLHEILAPHGRVQPQGSYFLDLMMYPDIDLFIPPVSLDELFAIGAQLAASELVTRVKFDKCAPETLPGGLYVQPRVRYGNWGRTWKIDIWSVPAAVAGKQLAEQEAFKRRLTLPLREQILRYKYSILNKDHRTPVFSGYFICKAFLDEGMTDFDAVTRYLIANGVKMD
jgi:hypothetical protein